MAGTKLKTEIERLVDALGNCLDTLDAIKNSTCSNPAHAILGGWRDVKEARKLHDKYTEALT